MQVVVVLVGGSLTRRGGVPKTDWKYHRLVGWVVQATIICSCVLYTFVQHRISYNMPSLSAGAFMNS